MKIKGMITLTPEELEKFISYCEQEAEVAFTIASMERDTMMWMRGYKDKEAEASDRASLFYHVAKELNKQIKEVVKMNKLIPFIFLLTAACGGSVPNHPVAEVIDNYTEQPEKDQCYVTSQNRIEDFLVAMQVTKRWYNDPVIFIPDNMPDNITAAIHHVINTINRNMDVIELTTTEDQYYGTIVFHYNDLGLAYHGTERTESDGNEITYSDITINSNPQVRGNYIDGSWSCDKARQALVSHELLHALGFHHVPHSWNDTVMWGLGNSLCANYWSNRTIPTRLELDALHYHYNDRMGYNNCH